MVEKCPVLGLFDSDEEMLDMMQTIFALRGYKSFGELLSRIQGNQAHYERFINRYNPQVIVMEIGIPYQQNWSFAKELMGLDVSRDLGFVFTTTDPMVSGEKIDKADIFELVWKPFHFDQLVEAIDKTYKNLKNQGKF